MALSAALSGFVFGYEIGIIDSILKMESFQLYMGTAIGTANGVVEADDIDSVNGWIVTLFLFGCMSGTVIVGWIADAIGRQRSILTGAALFIVGGALQASAQSLEELYAYRFVSGIGIGVLSEVAPLYLSECAEAATRGRYVAVQQLLIVCGLLSASCVNALLYTLGAGDAQWRSALAIQCAPGALLIVLALRLPESPRWLVAHGRDAVATKVLADLRRVPGHDPALQSELRSIRAAVDAEAGEASSWVAMLRSHGDVRAPLIAACALQFFQQCTGINAILYYAADLYERVGIPRETASTTLVIVTSLITVLATLPGMVLVETPGIGRRQLLLWGAAGMAGAHTAVATFVYMLPPEVGAGGDAATSSPSNAALSWCAVGSVYLFTAIFAATWGPVVWIVGSEVLPLHARAKGTALAAFTNWSTNAVVGKATPLLLGSIGAGTYAVFATLCIVMGIYVWAAVPETAGVPLEDMAALWRPAATAKANAGASQLREGTALAVADTGADGERRPLRAALEQHTSDRAVATARDVRHRVIELSGVVRPRAVVIDMAAASGAAALSSGAQDGAAHGAAALRERDIADVATPVAVALESSVVPAHEASALSASAMRSTQDGADVAANDAKARRSGGQRDPLLSGAT